MRVKTIATGNDRNMTSEATPTSGSDPYTGTGPGTPVTPATPAAPGAESPPATQAPPTTPRKRSLRTRTGYTWVALVAAAVLGIILLVFILQNLDKAEVTLFFWSFSIPLGITILLSVIAGALVMALVGGGRILQLRRAAKRG